MQSAAPLASCKIFVRYQTAEPSEAEIRAIFSKHGTISDLKLYSRFCFIEYYSESSAVAAIGAENRTKFKDVTLEVEGVVRNIPKRKADVSETQLTAPVVEDSEEPSVKVFKQDSMKSVKWKDVSKEDGMKKDRITESRNKVKSTDAKSEASNPDAVKVKRLEKKEQENDWNHKTADGRISSSLSLVSQSKTRADILGNANSSDKSTENKWQRKDHERNQTSGDGKSMNAPSTSKDYHVNRKDSNHDHLHLRSETSGSVCSPDLQNFASSAVSWSNEFPESYTLNHPIASPNIPSHGFRPAPQETDAFSSLEMTSVAPGSKDQSAQHLSDSWKAQDERLNATKTSSEINKGPKGTDMWSDLFNRYSAEKSSQVPQQESLVDKLYRIANEEKAPHPVMSNSFNSNGFAELQSQSIESMSHRKTDSLSDSSELGVCEIVVIEPRLRYYALKVASKVHSIGLRVEICDLPPTHSITDEIEDAMDRGCLYAIVITDLHAERDSVTVDILCGVPEEHRNMIIDDAITLIRESYRKYVDSKKPTTELKTKSSEPYVELSVSDPTVRLPKQNVQKLIVRLSKYESLSQIELGMLISYLRKRQNFLRQANQKTSLSSIPGIQTKAKKRKAAELFASLCQTVDAEDDCGSSSCAGPRPQPPDATVADNRSKCQKRKERKRQRKGLMGGGQGQTAMHLVKEQGFSEDPKLIWKAPEKKIGL